MRPSLTFFFASLVVACSSAPPAPRPAPLPPVVVAAVPSPPVVVSAEPTPPESTPPESLPPVPPSAPLPPAVELTLPIACVYDTERFTGAEGVTELALVPGGKPFTRITDGAAHLSIPTGLASDTLLEIRDGGLVVRGHASASAIVLRPNAPFVLNDFAIPTNSASLSYADAAAGSMTVIHKQPAEVLFLGATLKGTRPCTELGLDTKSFDPAAGIPGLDPKKRGTIMIIDGRRDVDLRIKPNGKTVARLKKSTDATLVFVSETAGGMSKISLSVDTLMIFGWVKSSDLKQAGNMAGFGTGRGRMGIRDPELPILDRVRCDTEIPLIAEAFGERKWVGSIRENTIIEVISKTETETRVWVKTRGIHSAPNAEFRVRTSDLSACKPVVTP